MSSSDSFSPTYESFVRKSRPKKTLECDYNECHKQFVTLSLLDSHKRREHTVSALPTTRVPTVCPPIHRCLHNGCGLEFAGEYTLRAHQRAGHKDPTPVMSRKASGGGNDNAFGLAARPTRTAYRTVYGCGQCNMIFVTEIGLNSHQQKRHSRTGKQGVHSAATKRHDCAHDGCGQSYASERALQKHLRCVHSAKGGQYRCDDCIQRFYHQFKLDRHRLTVHSEAIHALQASVETVVNVPTVHSKVSGQYRCDFCAKKFNHKYSLDLHCLTVHSVVTNVLQESIEHVVNVLSVPMETTVPESVPIAPATVQPVTQSLRPSLHYCPTTVIIESNNCISDTSSDENSGHELADRRLRHSFFTCDIDDCGQRFSWQYGLNRHKWFTHNVSIGGRAHPCGQCERSFNTIEQWAKHTVECWPTLPSLQEYMCQKCDKRYVTADGLVKHWVRRHPPPPAPFMPCGECDRRFLSDYHLDNHRRSAHSHPLFACDECSQRPYRTRRELNDHRYAVHSQPIPNPFTCILCDQQFVTDKQRLRHQMSVHSIPLSESLICKKCGQWFANAFALSQHKLDKKNH